MKRSDALVLLVNSLSVQEKKVFKRNRPDTDYMALFSLIDKSNNIETPELKKQFEGVRPKANFNIAVSYLYKLILDSLLSRKEQDHQYYLFQNILKAKILFEKAIHEEALYMLKNVKKEALLYEDYHALLMASSLELEYLLFLNFPHTTEADLVNKHIKIKEYEKNLRRINEHSALYDLLKYRLTYSGKVRSEQQKQMLYDLVISEMNLASSKSNSFESEKLHKLFQANYLMDTGDSKSAIHSYYELIDLFNENQHLLANPPFYYLFALEGVLDNLRMIHAYDKMDYFIDELKKIKNNSASFQTNVDSLVFLYTLFPLLDKGYFQESLELMKKYKFSVIDKMNNLSLTRQAEISLYIAVIHIGLEDFVAAKRSLLNIIIRGNIFYEFPLYRTIRLINLIVNFELDDYELIEYEIRSIKRSLRKNGKGNRVEHMVLDYLSKMPVGMTNSQRDKLWEKVKPDIDSIRQDVFEQQILKYFDFTIWLEAKIRNLSFTAILKSLTF